MSRLSIQEAKTQLASLEQALAGDEVIITEGANAVVRLVPVEPLVAPPVTERKPGSLKGLQVDERFFEPLS